MAGNYQTDKKRTVVITILAVVIAVLIGVSAFFIYSYFSQKDDKKSKNTSSTPKEQSSSDISTKDEAKNPVNQHITEIPAGTEDVTIPTEEIQFDTHGGEITYFNATYIPHMEVEDLSTGSTVTLRDVFGQESSNGVITFNDDGTFFTNFDSSGAQTGRYQVENREISATYYPDRELNITVTKWNEETKQPAEFTIIVGEESNGYKLFFTEN